MAATIPAVVLESKPTESFPLRYGIFQASIGPLDIPGHARNGGLQYVTAVCGEGFGYDNACIADLASKVATWTENGTTTVLGVPFLVLATVQCGSVGYDFEEQKAFVMERLRSVEQSQVEEMFSTGAGALFPALLTADGIETVTGGGTTVVEVLSELERARYCGTATTDIQYGPRAVLHVPIPVLNELKAQHVIEFDGTRWRTPLGTVVSAGCYAGNDPDGVAAADGVFWMYITGQTTIWRSSDEFVMDNIAPAEGSLDRTTNQFMMLAEREYVITYECGGFAKPVTLWTP